MKVQVISFGTKHGRRTTQIVIKAFGKSFTRHVHYDPTDGQWHWYGWSKDKTKRLHKAYAL